MLHPLLKKHTCLNISTSVYPNIKDRKINICMVLNFIFFLISFFNGVSFFKLLYLRNDVDKNDLFYIHSLKSKGAQTF